MIDGESFIAIGAFVIQAIALAVGGMRALSASENRIIDKITTHRSEIDAAIDEERRQAESRNDQLRREIGETIGSLRQALEFARAETQKVREWALEVFSRRDSVSSAMDRLEARLNKIDNKLDSLTASAAAAAVKLAGEG